MNRFLCQRVDETALNAWPALQQMIYDGWIIRYSEGYTKRANCVNVMYPSDLPLLEKVCFCEKFYRIRHINPLFRLTSFFDKNGLDVFLEGRGYTGFDTTLVMTRKLEAGGRTARQGNPVKWIEKDRWIKAYGTLSGFASGEIRIRQRIIESITGNTFFACMESEGKVIACGLGVLEGPFLGLFSFITHPAHRRKGHAGRILTALAARGRDTGAETAYLQVEEANTAAVTLYLKHGFSELYRYWYREKR